MKIRFLLALCGVVCSLTISGSVGAQSLEEARQLYKAGRYADAKPLFERLIRNSPGNSSLNQWYGVCLYETGEKEASEKYLRFAASRKIQDAYLYLGRLCYDQYRFDESVENYNRYLAILKKAKGTADRMAAEEPALERSELGARMLNRIEEVVVIDSLVVDKASFLEQYRLSPEFGTLHAYDEIFPGSGDVESVVYQNQRRDRIVYAAPSDSGRYRLQSRTRMVNGAWGEPMLLPEPVNRAANVNYPFLLSDGVTLYFAADGPGSLGGYDIFVTRYNLNNDTYLAPENIGMPFNSIYNDYLLAIDETNDVGWFVTDRFQPAGKVTIYLFIPNDSKRIYRSEEYDAARLRSLARIASIRDTWPSDADYAELLHRIYTQPTQLPEQRKADFRFVITDRIVYTTPDDFESDEARTLYESVREQTRLRREAETELRQLRRQYAEGNAPAALADTIRAREVALEEIYGEVERLEIQARNREIGFLRTQNNTR